jgi:hypothetical protein
MIRLRRNRNSHPPTPSLNGDRDSRGIDPGVSIRPLATSDDDALTTLAGRDSARRPTGSVIGVEKDGRLLAAISTASGQVVADPFYPTADLVELLRLRAGQILPPAA